ncbi:centromere protein J-like isoform X1 [Pomacea canaliculata]|uniref:centromere protein J-like isoform X1 n=1 Tax=Pomacea canaliculata TaxID=400727 RepID=UPI000D726BE6|nr:centromere protein J-like isoform X1 [Pomacea canaliculata]
MQILTRTIIIATMWSLMTKKSGQAVPHKQLVVCLQKVLNSSSTPPTSKLVSRLFPNLKPKPTKAQIQQQQRFQLASNSAMGDGVQSKVLRDKLAELEAEIERFRNENAALEKLRREREEGLGKLKEEITRFDREKTEELKRLEEFKIQETKKLKQERKLFETYQKQVRAMPDKKEREEIDMLRTQLAELQEELKRKDGRWTSNVTRLKARISELETENTELREEIKILERRRLQWVQTQGAKNTQVPPPKPQGSSTPTDMDKGTLVNGNHTPDVSTAQSFKPKGHITTSQPTTSLPLEVVANGTGYAGKTTFVPVTQNSGGESVPRAQPATPSMIEGVSSSSMTGHQGESTGILARQGSLQIPAERPGVDKGNRQYEEKQYPDGKVEHVYSNGSREVLFSNGTRKEISSDGQYIVVSFFNGDIKQIFPDQRVVYYYAEAQTTHTTYPDKLEVLQFPNNQTEKHYPDGTKEIIFPDQTVKYLFPNGTEESIFQDGTIMRIDKNGERILEFPNGQREIHTQHYKRREYPDGTVKTLHNDGRQETRYSTGRLRLKDKDGNILVDKMC